MNSSEKNTLNQGVETISNQEKYHKYLDNILNRQLSPENIFTYTADALDDVISLAQTVVADYTAAEYLQQADVNRRDLEEAAFESCGLNNIGTILDYIADRADDVNKIKELIDRAKVGSCVILPSNRQDPKISKEYIDGSFGENVTIPRLETILMVLKNYSDVNIEDEGQCRVTSGVFDSKMMRQQVYYMVEASTVNRLFFVCNEEKNATYVFNTSILHEKGIMIDDLARKTKDEINEIIDQNSGIGKKVRYNKNFTGDIEKLIKNGFLLDADDEVSNNNESGKYLRFFEKLPDGYASIKSIAKNIGISPIRIKSFVDENATEIGVVNTYRYGPQIAHGYSIDQQKIIHSHFLENELHAPDGYVSLSILSNSLGINIKTLRSFIESISEELGALKKYLFGTRLVTGYSPEQQNIIRLRMEENDLLTARAPEGFSTLADMRKKLGTGMNTIPTIVSNIDENFGEIKLYRFGTKSAFGYSPEQQRMIASRLLEIRATRLKKIGTFTTEVAKV